jgi:hypothetical protein
MSEDITYEPIDIGELKDTDDILEEMDKIDLQIEKLQEDEHKLSVPLADIRFCLGQLKSRKGRLNRKYWRVKS